jgi:uncharacterized protein YkwD
MRRAAASVCLITLFALIAAPGAMTHPAARGGVALTSREASLIVAINAVRTLHLLPTLRFDSRLTRAARSHSRDMLRHQYFAHGDFGARMAQFRVRGRLFAENLVWSSGVMSANAAVAQWLASPPHRANLLDPELRRVGVGTPVGAFAGFSTATVVTADFAGG